MTDSLFGSQWYDALDTAHLIKSGAVTAAEVLEATIERIEAVNPGLNFISVEAYDLGRKLASEPLPAGAFQGVPFLLKDIAMDWPGVRSTAGSVMWKDYVSNYSSYTSDRAVEAGFVMFGKTTVPEWGWSYNSHSLLCGPTRNAWATDRTAGGSSGGAAAAVASRAVPIAAASDGGGSIRVPAAFGGLVGLKPSRGRIPCGPAAADGMYGFATEGCISVTVRDTAAHLDAMAGSIPGEVYPHAPGSESFLQSLDRPRRNLRIGFTWRSGSGHSAWAEGRIGVEKAARLCADLGHHVEEADISFDYEALYEHIQAIADVSHAALVGASEKLFGRPAGADDYSSFIRVSAEQGRARTALDHMADIEGVRRFSRIIAGAMQPYDVIITPTCMGDILDVDWNLMWETEFQTCHHAIRDYGSFTFPMNCSGQPAISLPLHWSESGLPVGIQFCAAYGREALLLNLASQLEQVVNWKDRVPPVNALSALSTAGSGGRGQVHQAVPAQP